LEIGEKNSLSEIFGKKTIEAKKAEETKKVPFPQINTSELPHAKVGVKYQSVVLATLTNANEDLQISVAGLPEGLSLGECGQEFNTNLIPIPNTRTRCVIEGIPIKVGLYQIKISVTNKNNTVEQMIDLVVQTSQ
jgi:hypothetical protein